MIAHGKKLSRAKTKLDSVCGGAYNKGNLFEATRKGAERAFDKRRRFGYIPRKGVIAMRITITFHVLRWTVSIVVKSGNRHSAK